MLHSSANEAEQSHSAHAQILGVNPKIDFIAYFTNEYGLVSHIYNFDGTIFECTNLQLKNGRLVPINNIVGTIKFNEIRNCTALYYGGKPYRGANVSQREFVFVNQVLAYTTDSGRHTALMDFGSGVHIQFGIDSKCIPIQVMESIKVILSGSEGTSSITNVTIDGIDYTSALEDPKDNWNSQPSGAYIRVYENFETFYAG